MLKHFALCELMTLGLLALCPAQATSQETKTGKTVEVRVNYAGSGAVDENHPIYVVMWDTAAFVEKGSQVPPIATKPVTSKDGTAVFDNVAANPAYISAAYDPAGKWKATSAPPSGSSLGLYANSDGKPQPVKVNSDKPASITLKFDDAFKVP
ncbi:MAG TPA: hypothetical protein VES20_02530 [Bryobacteraceae bacterium]|nr:hypothetical protein [Bryobacteraceae bacterium]